LVLINVWASWCSACKVEHPVLMELAQRGVAPIIGLNYKDAPEDARAVLKADGNPYEVSLIDRDGRTGIDWGVYGVPETFLVKDGIILYKHIGPIAPGDWEQKFEPKLKSR
jgi:cytochrome c biogenesis protein CcmG/thiol:disulfide interchange protein DsbE